MLRTSSGLVGCLVCLAVFLLVGVACSPAATLPADAPLTSTVVSTRASPRPSQVASLTLQPTPTRSPTHRPTVTPAPRPTLFPTPSAYTLPSWLADPAVPVVAATMNISSVVHTLAFINLATGERFDLPVAYTLGYFWTPDGQAFGLLDRDKRTAYLIDLASGVVSYHSLPDQATQFLVSNDQTNGGLPSPLVASTSSPDDPAFLLLHRKSGQGRSYYPTEFSADRSYMARYDAHDNVVVEELVTGRVITVTDPGDNVHDWEFLWSPTDHRLAVLQGVSDMLPFSYNADRITVYDASTGATLNAYPGAFEDIEWAPDGNRLLFQGRAGEDGARNVPCVLDLATGERSCLSALAGPYPEASFYTTLYGWAPDGLSVTYIHCNNGFPELEGGFCFFDLQSSSAFCPTQGLADMQGRAVRGYDVSPDGQYIALLTDTMCPSDDTGYQGAFVIKRDGSGYYSLWQPNPEGHWTIAPPFETLLWRPMPMEKPQPLSWQGPLLYPGWDHGEWPALPLYDLGIGQTVYLTTTEPIDEILDWSPDGCTFAYTTGDEPYSPGARLRMINIVTCEDTILADLPQVEPARVDWTWSPSGQRAIYSYAVQGEDEEYTGYNFLTDPNRTDSKPLPDGYGFTWLPWERQLLYWTSQPAEGAEYYWQATKHLHLLDLDSMQSQEIAHFTQPLDSWTTLAITDIQTMQPVPLQMPGEPGGAIYVWMEWTPDFRHVLLTVASACGPDEDCGIRHLDLIDVASGQVQQLNVAAFGMGDTALSRDGTHYAFEAYGFETDSRGPWTYWLDITTGEVRRLAQEENLYLSQPEWAPDATALSFYSVDEGHAYVYQLATGEVTPLPAQFDRARWGRATWVPKMWYAPGDCQEVNP